MSAAVYVYGSSSTSYPILKITDGAKITDNYNLAYNSNGLGVFVGNYRKVLMTGGEISGNSAVIKEGGTLQVNGGGVFVDDKGTFEMSGGKICDNVLSVQESSVSCGGAVYLMSGGTFKMSGKSYISYGGSDGKNDIYLSGTAGNTAKITIAGELSTPSGYVSGPCAVIRLQTYSPKNIVLSGDTDILKDIAEIEKIKIADQGSGTDAVEWILSKNGNEKMRLKYPLMKMYVKSTGSDSNLGNSVNNAFATLDQCWNVITEQEVADGEYEIYISGTITGKQIIPKTTTGTNALNIKKDTTVKSILISGNSALSGGSPQDTIDANVCIYANYANKGAGVSNAGELTVKDGRIYDNKIKVTNSYLGGGGIYSTSGSVTYILIFLPYLFQATSQALVLLLLSVRA